MSAHRRYKLGLLRAHYFLCQEDFNKNKWKGSLIKWIIVEETGQREREREKDENIRLNQRER